MLILVKIVVSVTVYAILAHYVLKQLKRISEAEDTYEALTRNRVWLTCEQVRDAVWAMQVSRISNLVPLDDQGRQALKLNLDRIEEILDALVEHKLAETRLSSTDTSIREWRATRNFRDHKPGWLKKFPPLRGWSWNVPTPVGA